MSSTTSLLHWELQLSPNPLQCGWLFLGLMPPEGEDLTNVISRETHRGELPCPALGQTSRVQGPKAELEALGGIATWVHPPRLSVLGMCTATGRGVAATVQGETAAAAGRLGLAPVHKEVIKKINSELVPVCFQIQEDKDMNIGLRATILPILGSKKQMTGGCMGNALWPQVTT